MLVACLRSSDLVRGGVLLPARCLPRLLHCLEAPRRQSSLFSLRVALAVHVTSTIYGWTVGHRLQGEGASPQRGGLHAAAQPAAVGKQR